MQPTQASVIRHGFAGREAFAAVVRSDGGIEYFQTHAEATGRAHELESGDLGFSLETEIVTIDDFSQTKAHA